MTAPTTYTTKTFAEYMHNVVEESVRDTGWTTGPVDDADDVGAYAEPINDVLLDMGLSDVSQITVDSVLEARLRARVAIWLAVTENKVPFYDAGGAQRTLTRSQVFNHAFAMLRRAEAKLALWVREQDMNNAGGVPTSSMTRIRTVWGSDDPNNPND